MKPEFALSLSFDGIRLLQRAAGGWRAVGDVDITSETLKDDLSALCQKAHSVKKRRLRTKLIIPDGQIKYLTIETGDVGYKERRAAAALALDGATPYAVDDLAFDISIEGPTTHIAAVANETLSEAETFAVDHKFNPVSFVAAPEGDGFLGEPFFGQTAHSTTLLPDGKAVQPDGICVVVIDHDVAVSDTVLADPTLTPAAGSAPPEPTPRIVTEADVAPVATDIQSDDPVTADPGAPEDFAAAPEEASPAPAAPVALSSETGPAYDDAAQNEPEAVTETDAAAFADDISAPIAPPEADVDPSNVTDYADADADDPATLLGFATRRRANGGGAAALGGVTREPPKALSKARIHTSDKAAAPPPIASPVAEAKTQPAAIPIEDVPPEPKPVAARKEKTGFLSRRKPRQSAPAQIASDQAPAVAARRAAPTPTSDAAAVAAAAEAQRMTVFGARSDVQVGGKPRFLGLILTAVLLIFLAGVAAWASVFLDDGLAKLFPKRERTLASTLPADVSQTLADDVGATVELEPEEERGDELIVASLNDGLIEDGLTAEDAAVLDALRNPLPDPAAQEELDEAALEARYAVTGIWPQAPRVPPVPLAREALDDLYITSIDPVSPALDAVALPKIRSLLTDVALPDIASPPAAGTNFALDLNGRIVPTEDGALSPDGFTVFLGKPPRTPPVKDRVDAPPVVTPAPETNLLAGIRPRARPDNLVEQNERASLGGLTRLELAALRPRLRPAAPQELAAPQPEDTQENGAEVAETAPVEETGTALAVAKAFRPESRPRNFARTVARAQRNAQQSEPARVAAVAPRTVRPSIPTATSVARAATVNNAINLSRVNLIGVYGTPTNRRALVRLKNGRYQKVKVGDRFDGGRVSAIDNSQLRYQKGNRNLVLEMPN